MTLCRASVRGIRDGAAGSLGQIWPAGATVVAGLAKALSDPSPRVRDLAAIAPEAMGEKAIASIPGLIYALNDPINYVRASVAKVFGAMEPAAQSAVGPLTENLLLKDEDGFVRLNAAYALGDIGPAAKEAIPAHQSGASIMRRNYDPFS